MIWFSVIIIVLGKIQSGELKLRHRSVLNTVMKDRHVFCGGTSIDDEGHTYYYSCDTRMCYYYTHTDYVGDKESRLYYKDLIEECKSERSKAVTTKSKSKSTRKKTVERVELVGRRVVMSADVFGGKDNECYHGLVVGKGRYKQKGKICNGYRVR